MLRNRSLRPVVRTMVSAALFGAVGSFGAAAAVALPSGHAGVNHLISVRGDTADSLNWAGYAVTPGSGITAVSGNFTVPSAGELPPGFSASWAGIGGYTTSDLIQAGVSENSAIGGEVLGGQYNAWYEILPASETPISGCSGDSSCTVSPGDKVSVNISNTGGDNWDVSLSDAGKWSWSTSVTYASSESSAEWIQEAPSLEGVQTIPADVGTVSFGASTFSEGGSTDTIAEGSPTLIDESPLTDVNEATTSPLAPDGQSFNVCVYAQSCAAP
jgi:hypothetical protein